MSMTQHPSLLDTDREILRLLQREARQTPSMLLTNSETTQSKQFIQNRLKHLRDTGLIHRPGRGIYELTETGERAVENLDMHDNDRDAFWDLIR